MEQKKRKLDDGERKRLIEAVKKHDAIWDKTHPDYMKRNILKLAWDSVSIEMDVDVESCKVGWRSIRDRERYNKKKSTKRGRARDIEYYSDNSSGEPWEYTDDMKFLADSTSPRLNCSDYPADNMSPDPSTSSYSYRSNTPISRQASCLNESMFNVVEIVEYKEKVDDSFSNHLEQRRINYSADLMASASADVSSERSKSSYSSKNDDNVGATKRQITAESENVSFLNHLDFILNKLSIRSSESLQAKIIALAYEELSKQREQS